VNKNFGAPGCTPYFEVFRIEGLENQLIYDNRSEAVFHNILSGMVYFKFPPLKLYGNILIQFKSKGSMKDTNLFRLSFNTAFVGGKMSLKKTELSPESIHKDSNTLEKGFYVIMQFEDVCEKCKSTETYLEEICENCRSEMFEEIEHWSEAKNIIEEHIKNGPKGRDLIKN
jgi:RNA polymerase subunit RPABC4/transcription elongation factor Spt4